ncbi:MAG: RICIN domain-containing protein, partial [Eggerthellaceae bacterium]|nr:RICIN domain-containing protein [Eggerthellaceae bacterium]
MERSVTKYPWLAVIILALAAALAMPGIAMADEAMEPLPTSAGDSSLVTENDGNDAVDAAGLEADNSATVEEGDGQQPNNQAPEGNENVSEEPAQPAAEEPETVEVVSDEPVVEEPVGDEAAEPVVAAEAEEPAAAAPAQDVAEDTPQAVAATATTAAATTAATAAPAATAAAAPAAKKTAKKAAAKKSPSRPLADGWYIIESAKKLSLVLGINTKNGNANAQKDKNKSYQRWYLKYSSSKGGYRLKNDKTGKYLAVAGGSKKSGTNVLQLSKSAGGKGAVWKIKVSDAGTYILQSLLGHVYLDINNGKKVKNGANVD